MIEMLPMTRKLDVFIHEAYRRGFSVQFNTWMGDFHNRKLEFSLRVCIGLSAVCGGGEYSCADENKTIVSDDTMYVRSPESVSRIVESVVKQLNEYIAKRNQRENPAPKVFKLDGG